MVMKFHGPEFGHSFYKTAVTFFFIDDSYIFTYLLTYLITYSVEQSPS